MWGNISANILNYHANNTKILYCYHSAKTTYHVANSRITILSITEILHLAKTQDTKALTHKLGHGLATIIMFNRWLWQNLKTEFKFYAKTNSPELAQKILYYYFFWTSTSMHQNLKTMTTKEMALLFSFSQNMLTWHNGQSWI